MFLGDASFVSMIDGLLVFGGGVGFGPCRALILGPCDVVVYNWESWLSWQRWTACRSKTLHCTLCLKELGTGLVFGGGEEMLC